MSVRVLIVDDQRIVREGLSLLLRTTPDVEPVGAAENGRQALDLVADLMPDVVLMDLRMPELDGVEATRAIRAAHPQVQVIVLTTYSDDESVFAALRAGARGYLTKDAEADELARAIQRVHAGKAMLDSDVQARLLDRLDTASEPTSAHASGSSTSPLASGAPVRAGAPVAAGSPSAVPGSEPFPDDLTGREVEVLALIARGLSNAEIAQELVLSEATVKTHINRLFAKTGVRDRAQAVRYAYQHGLATP